MRDHVCPGIILVSAVLVVQFGGLRFGSVLDTFW